MTLMMMIMMKTIVMFMDELNEEDHVRDKDPAGPKRPCLCHLLTTPTVRLLQPLLLL